MQTELKGFVRPHAVSCRAGLHSPSPVSHNKRATRMISGAKCAKVEKDLHATGTQHLELTLLFDAHHLADVTGNSKKNGKGKMPRSTEALLDQRSLALMFSYFPGTKVKFTVYM
jgi:hypothetical protein